MHAARSVPPYERVAAGAVAAMRTAGTPNLLLVSGPSDFELGAVLDELSTAERRLQEQDARPAPDVVRMSFGASPPGMSVVDRLVRLAGTGAGDRRPDVLLMRNLQQLAPDELPLLEDVVRRWGAAGTRCVGTVTLPLPRESRDAFGAVLDGLRRDGLVRQVTLRPLSVRRFAAAVTAEIEAKPEPTLVSWLWRLTRGWPATARAVLRTAREQGLIRVVGRHAHLVSGSTWQRSVAFEDLVLTVRELAGPAWSVAKAVAVLGQLGDAVPELAAEALGVPEGEVRELLAHLVDAGLVRRRRADGGWEYRLPLAWAAVWSALGPYERRDLARIAVTALWQGTAHCADRSYLPERLASAGRLVDPARASAELLAAVEESGRDDDRAGRWLLAAARLTPDPAQRPRLLLDHARVCVARGAADEGLESLRAVLRDHRDGLRPHQLLDVCYSYLAALYRAGDLDALQRIATDGVLDGSGTVEPLERAVVRGCALLLLGRWREARDVIGPVRDEALRGGDRAGWDAWRAEFLLADAELWLGLGDGTARDEAGLAARYRAGEATDFEVPARIGALLTLGEIGRAEELLDQTGYRAGQLGTASRMLIAFHRGRPREALDLTRRSAVTGTHTCDAVESAMYHHAVVLLVSGGRLNRASELIALARARQPNLPHLLTSAEALCELVFGEAERAVSLLRGAVRRAEAEGVVAGTELLWLRVADVAMSLGRPEALVRCLAKAEWVAHRLGTDRAEMARLVLHAAVHGDASAGQEALRLARWREQPLEEGAVLTRLIRHGLGDAEMLRDTYALLGGVDALMPRFWLRTLMRARGVAVPGRQATAAENERLLGVLVSEGLTNRRIAQILGTSEKSVEGRLSRLFARTGHGSRVELATALLTGRLQW
ncbi:helix-turn-helix domain-containing protein [Streptomyces sp. NPDC087294]|uniref:helix-turn-helix domain-containing protein n=1 Tax=Streptomyces sp. NPDC087294 TaxID=3365777 RepID=UPI00381B7DAF